MAELRLALIGFGMVGQGVLRLAAAKAWIDVVAVIVRRPQLDGRSASEFVPDAPAGLLLSTDGATLAAAQPDVVLVATRSTLPEVLPHLRLATTAGAAVACTAEDLGYIAPDDGPEAAAIFALARARGVAIVQVGLNPGFLLDAWPLMLASVAGTIEAIEALRVVDVSAYGPRVRASLGIGFAPDEFARALSEGRTSGHRGFPESLRLMGAALGRPVDTTRIETEPIIARADRTLAGGELRRGQTAGVRQIAIATSNGDAWLRAEMTASAALDELDTEPVDRLRVRGDPALTVTITPSVPSLAGTVARIVNALPAIAAAPPGVHDTTALGITPPWIGAGHPPGARR